MIDEIAQVYAEGLFDLGRDTGDLDEIDAHFERVMEIIDASPQFRILLETPALTTGRRQELATEVFSGRITDYLYKFLMVLIDRGRAARLHRIYFSFRMLMDEHRGILRLKAVSAFAMSDAERKQLMDAVARATGKTILAETSRNEALLGGFILQYGGLRMDFSLRRSLQELQSSMLDQQFDYKRGLDEN